ncbi:hypothetical protein [Microbacterium sp. PAMC21962]|uniref:hypothetical protein n=1 Tax=Microbacterium sp. PAMC21962 TaxID=2861280 RepID=UPI001C632CB5|nr:hypothetical protein [Microbacterium sp. PAMC21962]QYF98124.1 hypothetical protein KY498_02385 [Microbacterium sp. PAMC21962]
MRGARKLQASMEGEDWLYRDPRKRRWMRVVLLVVPSDAATRVRVQHLDPKMQGAAEWVPATRLAVPWSERDDYIRRYEEFEGAERLAPSTPVADLAAEVLAAYLAEAEADFDGNGSSGILRLVDIAAVAEASGIAENDLRSAEGAFVDQGTVCLPWPQAEKVLIRVCRRRPEAGQRWLRDAQVHERTFAHSVAAHGERWWLDQTDDGYDTPLAYRLRQWRRGDGERMDAIQRWLAPEDPSIASRYAQLERMYLELAEEARRAIPRILMVRSQISQDHVDRLQYLIERPLPTESGV